MASLATAAVTRPRWIKEGSCATTTASGPWTAKMMSRGGCVRACASSSDRSPRSNSRVHIIARVARRRVTRLTPTEATPERGCYGDDDDELEALGAILLAQRLSELSLAPELRDTFGVREPEAPRRAFTSRARSIIAVPLGGDEDDVPSRPAATRASDAPPRLDHEPPPGPPDYRHPPLRDAAARAGVAKLERWGAVLFEGALDERRAAEGGRAVLAELAAPTYPFVDINCPKRRHDYPASLAFPGAAASLLEARRATC